LTRRDLPELLDQESLDPAELAGNLGDLARLNRLTGTTDAALRLLDRVMGTRVMGTRALGTRSPVCVLDVGSGAGDLPRAICAHRPAQVIALDVRADVLRFATRYPIPVSRVDWLQGSGLALPIADGAVDVAICVQTAHHLDPEALGGLIREMARVSRRGCIMIDLDRAWLAPTAIGVLTMLLSRNRMTRHDGPLSARRAYTAAEFAAIAAAQGCPVTIRPIWPFRWGATFRRSG
jgi:SAM-dependent methyltransferase